MHREPRRAARSRCCGSRPAARPASRRSRRASPTSPPGLYERVLVVGADRVRESGDAQKIFNKIWDPFYERPLPFTTITMIAMSAGPLHGQIRHDREADGAGLGEGAPQRRPQPERAHPPRGDDRGGARLALPRLADQAARRLPAVGRRLRGRALLGRRGRRPAQRPAWITGISMAGESYFIGDRLEVLGARLRLRRRRGARRRRRARLRDGRDHRPAHRRSTRSRPTPPSPRSRSTTPRPSASPTSAPPGRCSRKASSTSTARSRSTPRAA